MHSHSKLYEEAAGDGGTGGAGGGGADPVGASAPASAVSSGASLLGGASGAASDAQFTEKSAASVQAAGADPYFVGLYDKSGKIDKSKYDALPADLKPYAETFKKYDTFESLLRGTANLVQLAGKKGLQPLPADAPEEAKKERAALMRQLNNVPEKVEGYGVQKPEGIPDELWNPDYANGMLGVLHKHNASPELVRELFEAESKFTGSQLEQSASARETHKAGELKSLKEAFGAEFAQKMDLAARGARTLGLDPSDEIFGNAKIVQAMAKVAEMISEDRLVSGESDTTMGGNDRSKALDIVNNAANPLHKAYHDPEDPRHQDALSTVMALNKRAVESKQARA